MDRSQQIVRSLILEVVALSEHTRGLAHGGDADPAALLPLRRALDRIERTLDGLARHWSQDPLHSAAPALPHRAPDTVGIPELGDEDAADGGSWLLGELS